MNRLKIVRRRSKLSQEQIAACLHISRQVYGMYERGQREPPAHFLVAFSDLMQVSIDYLLERESAPFFRLASPEENTLIEGFRQLDEAGKRHILHQVAFEQTLSQRALFQATLRD